MTGLYTLYIILAAVTRSRDSFPNCVGSRYYSMSVTHTKQVR